YTNFYNRIAKNPEAAVCRRFSRQRAWRLFYLERDVVEKEKSIVDYLVQSGVDRQAAKEFFVVLDWHYVSESKDEELKTKIKEYMESLNAVGAALREDSTIAKLPDPNQFFMDYFRSCLTLLGRRGLTGEDAAIYGSEGDAIDPDLCTLRESPDTDPLSKLILYKLSRPFDKHIGKPISRKLGKKEPEDTLNVPVAAFSGVISTMTCVVATLLFSVSTSVLYCIRSMKDRLVVIAVFGLIFSLSLIAFGRPSRSEVFGATAAYFAVMSVFVG
ncbi:hypothetical protein K432DRAFT_281716, partial [Lepidopterella palustris CBS 459.81]